MMKKFYKVISSVFSLIACIVGAFNESAAVIAAICAVAYAVLSVGEEL